MCKRFWGIANSASVVSQLPEMQRALRNFEEPQLCSHLGICHQQEEEEEEERGFALLISAQTHFSKNKPKVKLCGGSTLLYPVSLLSCF